MSVFDKLMDLQRQINTQQTLINQILRVDRPSGSPVSIISFKFVKFTGTQASSVGGGGSLNITDLEISHALTKSTNKLLLLAQLGIVANNQDYVQVGVHFTADGTRIINADLASSRVATAASGATGGGGNYTGLSHTILGPYEPASMSSIIYRVQAVNIYYTTGTIYINRTEVDDNSLNRPRGSSTFALFELEG